MAKAKFETGGIKALLGNPKQLEKAVQEHPAEVVRELATTVAMIPIEQIKFLRIEEEQGSGAKMIDFIEHQKDMIDLTKAECALIQPSTTANGTQTFDLPPNLKGQKGPDRARKDSYSALILANWMMNVYYDMMKVNVQKPLTFTPMFIK
jgi:hypothetical protein